MTANKDPTFIERRRRGLEIFLQYIVWVPYLFNTPAVQAFLSMTDRAYDTQIKLLQKKSEVDHLLEFANRFQQHLANTSKSDVKSSAQEVYGKSTPAELPAGGEEGGDKEEGGGTARSPPGSSENKNASSPSSVYYPTYLIHGFIPTDVPTLAPILKGLEKQISALPILQITRDKGLAPILKAYTSIIDLENKTKYRIPAHKRPDMVDYTTQWFQSIEAQPLSHIVAWFQWEIHYTEALQMAFEAPNKLEIKAKTQASMVERLEKQNAKEAKLEEANHKLEVLNRLIDLIRNSMKKELLPRYWMAKARLFDFEVKRISSVQLKLAGEMVDMWGKVKGKIGARSTGVVSLNPAIRQYLTAQETKVPDGQPSAPPAYGDTEAAAEAPPSAPNAYSSG